MAVQIAVIDDWQDVARDVVDWSVLESLGEVTFVHDYPATTQRWPSVLAGFQVICVMRERTRFDEDLLKRLPKLKLLVTGGMRNAALDMPAATRLGIKISGTDSYKHAAPELTWALIMAATRNLVNEANALRSGKWQQGLGGDLHGKTLGHSRLGSIGQKVAQFGQVSACASSPGAKTSPPNVPGRLA
jgi:lactate dehydrogenase-like 2-hydroxyacid dehydrogenase